jgi:nucleoside-diphosphate-sugar epimerase
MSRVVIAGCGYVGVSLGEMLARDGHEVWGLRRDPSGLPPSIRGVAADLSRPETLGAIPERIECAVYAAAPKAAGQTSPELAYRETFLDGLGNFLRALHEQGEHPRRIFFTSSTSVYDQQRGEWVDEDSPTYPARFAGEILVLAERLLWASEFQATAVRFGGIYGPGRTRLIDHVRTGEALRPAGPPHYTNRVHREDAAGILRHLMGLDAPERLYLGVDCEPAAEGDVLEWLADQLGVGPLRDAASATRPPRRRAGSKRCRNTRLLESGYQFQYPSFREGYASLFD